MFSLKEHTKCGYRRQNFKNGPQYSKYLTYIKPLSPSQHDMFSNYFRGKIIFIIIIAFINVELPWFLLILKEQYTVGTIFIIFYRILLIF